ncbi:protein translocase subunit SecD [Brevundimonas sp.]|uniref:protein translocase subunit SecD n=1 Tax=Brevundimonas sp. TaxID=1871086 RepID=UPI0025DD1E19|nr:protein translocase subunit SecD [Brevundimonas sp.]
MIQLSRWKVIVVVLAGVLGLLFALPNVLTPAQREALPDWMPSRTINLGLDLRGGSSLLLEVDIDDLREQRIANLAEDVSLALNRASIPHQRPVRGQTGVTVRLADPARATEAERALRELARPSIQTGAANLTVRVQDDGSLTAQLSQAALEQEANDAVSRSIEVIRRRLDPDGTREINPQRQGRDRIIVAAPGETDPEGMRRLIGQTARLTFHEVDSSGRVMEAVQSGRAPYGWMLMNDEGTPYLLRERPLLTGEMLTRSEVAYDLNQQPAVGLQFNGEGARIFGQYTTRNVGNAFAIVLDDEIVSVATIREPIPGGNGQISDVGGIERATEMVTLLNAGALPARLNVEEQRTVGAELGADAVRGGAIATTIAFIGVLAFMVLVYGVLFGGISVVAILVNGVLIIAAMSATGAALTLPGIAGLILTLAMAVDANVLIYERMRDEVRNGRTPIAAMDAGFSRAMVTIVDANLTTLIAAWIMFFFGAGPVRGFAWTLSIGVITSVFTAVLITQVLLAVWVRVARPKRLPIAEA